MRWLDWSVFFYYFQVFAGFISHFYFHVWIYFMGQCTQDLFTILSINHAPIAQHYKHSTHNKSPVLNDLQNMQLNNRSIDQGISTVTYSVSNAKY